MTAAVASWAYDRVTVIVPTGAPDGPAQVRLNTPAGAATADFFVGAIYDGPGSGLGAFAQGLEPGTHLLLAGEFNLGSDTLVLQGVSVWGQGKGVTVLNAPGGIAFLPAAATGSGSEVLMTQLTVVTDDFGLIEITPDRVGDLSVSESSGGMPLVILRDIEFRGSGDPGSYLHDDPHHIVNLSLRIEDVTVLAPQALLALRTTGDITISGLNADTRVAFLSAGMEEVEIMSAGSGSADAGKLEMSDAKISSQVITLYGRGGVDIGESELEAHFSSMGILGSLGGCIPGFPGSGSGGAVTVTGSTLLVTGEEADEEDWPAGFAVGDLIICTSSAPVTVRDNVVSVTGDLVINADVEHLAFSGNRVAGGYKVEFSLSEGATAEIAGNHFELDGTGLELYGPTSGMSGLLQVTDNSILLPVPQGGAMGLYVSRIAEAEITGNQILGATASGATGLTVNASGISEVPAGDLSLVVENNTFRNFGLALSVEGQYSDDGQLAPYSTFDVTGNCFVTESAIWEVAEIDDNKGNLIRATGNYWNGITELTELESLVNLSGNNDDEPPVKDAIDLSDAVSSPDDICQPAN